MKSTTYTLHVYSQYAWSMRKKFFQTAPYVTTYTVPQNKFDWSKKLWLRVALFKLYTFTGKIYIRITRKYWVQCSLIVLNAKNAGDSQWPLQSTTTAGDTRLTDWFWFLIVIKGRAKNIDIKNIDIFRKQSIDIVDTFNLGIMIFDIYF